MIVTKPPGRKRQEKPTSASLDWRLVAFPQYSHRSGREARLDTERRGSGRFRWRPKKWVAFEANDTENNTTRKHSCLWIFNTVGVPVAECLRWAVMLPAPSLQRSKAKYLKGINYASVVRDRVRFIRVRVYVRFFSLRFLVPRETE